MTHTPGKVQVFNVVHPDRGGAMTPDEIGKYIADAVRKTIAEGGGLTDRFLEISMADDPQLFLCHVGNGPAGLDNAQRIKALWNAAEDIGSTTREIEEGVIQFAFELGERHAEVINAAKERIEKLEAEKAEMGKVLLLVKMMIDSHAKHLTRGSGYHRLVEVIKNQGEAGGKE